MNKKMYVLFNTIAWVFVLIGGAGAIRGASYYLVYICVVIGVAIMFYATYKRVNKKAKEDKKSS